MLINIGKMMLEQFTLPLLLLLLLARIWKVLLAGGQRQLTWVFLKSVDLTKEQNVTVPPVWTLQRV